MWPMALLFTNTSPVKQYSYENDFSGVFDALHQSFLVCICPNPVCYGMIAEYCIFEYSRDATVYKLKLSKRKDNSFSQIKTASHLNYYLH